MSAKTLTPLYLPDLAQRMSTDETSSRSCLSALQHIFTLYLYLLFTLTTGSGAGPSMRTSHRAPVDAFSTLHMSEQHLITVLSTVPEAVIAMISAKGGVFCSLRRLSSVL